MSFIRKLMPQTLLVRFILIIILPTVIGQMFVIFLFYDRHWYNVSYYTGNLLTTEIKILLDNYADEEASDSSLSGEYLNLSYKFYPNAVITTKQSKLREELEILKNILDNKIPVAKILKINDTGKIEGSFQLKDGVMQITFPTKLLINPTTGIFIYWLIFLNSFLLSISVIFSRNQIKSILELASAADAFGKGIGKSYKPSGAREIRKTGWAFLKMKDRIERQSAKRTQMLAMISHDLRTPLTRMKLQLELMPDTMEKEDLQQDIETMRYMIDSYLDFAKGEDGEKFETINFPQWLTDNIKNKWRGLKNTQFNLTNEVEEVQAHIKPRAFERALSNILANAGKYATKIQINTYILENSLVIDIEDNGTGIKNEDKELVFKPFYRIDKARPLDDSSSTGLGLAIVKEIITGHYGTITLKDGENLGGLLVRITLPI